jgi:hypothetical protein
MVVAQVFDASYPRRGIPVNFEPRRPIARRPAVIPKSLKNRKSSFVRPLEFVSTIKGR